mgnify:CR=1 FL=1
MNKIDELKRDIEFHKRGVEISKSLLANAEKDLAALEAQERRPREFIIGVDKNGYPVSVGKYGTGILHHVSSGALLPEMYIGAIEKLPVKVTREIVAKLQKAYWGCVVPLDGMGLWVDVLKAAGIDAEPSND